METSRYTTITEVSGQLRTGKASPVKLVRECLDGIDRLNPVLNAFITVTAEQAILYVLKTGSLSGTCCGVTGFKGTYGLISTKGILEGEKTDDVIIRLAHAAITTRSAEDTALVLNVLADSKMSKGNLKGDYRRALESNKKVLLGVARNYTASKGVRDNFVKAVEVLEQSGYSTVDVEVPFEMASFNIASIEEDRRKITALLFKDIDALLLPTTTDSVPTIKEAEAAGPQAVSPNNTFFCNYFSLPAISVPCGQDENNLPLALQITGPPWGEGVVLGVANSFQKRTRWHLNHPRVI